MKTLITVPAVAAILLAGLSGFDKYFENRNVPEISQQTASITQTEKDFIHMVENSSEVIIYYVLDSVKSSEADMGIFLDVQNTGIQTTSPNPDIKLVSF